ncbi:hypothetical protein JCM11641_002087 [Rhodosporidiobolus odoratus]
MGDYPYSALATLKYKPPPNPSSASSDTPDFAFSKGDRLTVLAQADDDGDWLQGETEEGVKGVFPASFVTRIEEDEAKTGEEEETALLQQAIEQGVKENEAEFQTEKGEPKVKEQQQVVSEAESSPAEKQPPSKASSPSDGPPSSTSPPVQATQSSPPASSPNPPSPAKKPSGLQARLAFFQQQAEAAAPSQPPPVPRKPIGGGWKRPAPPPKSAADAGPEPSPSTSALPPPSLARAPSSSSTSHDPPPEKGETGSGSGSGFSAADAQESVARGGGSLKDRIAALQGMKLDQNTGGEPGRAPPVKPWKKKVVEEEEDKVEETEVKDQEPGIGRTTEKSQGGEVPGFGPAETEGEEETEGKEEEGVVVMPGAEGLEEERHTEEREVEKADEEQDEKVDVSATEAVEQAPVAGQAEEEASTLAGVGEPQDDSASPAVERPTIPATEEDDQPAIVASDIPTDAAESEAAQRSVIAARMAGLGGQRMGGLPSSSGGDKGNGGGGSVPIPALPKRSAGPRRNRAPKSVPAPAEIEVKEVKKEVPEGGDDESEGVKEATGVESVEGQVMQPPAEEVEDSQPKQEVQEREGDVLASMGGGVGSLLSRMGGDDSDDGDEPKKGAAFDDDEGDFETPPAPAAKVDVEEPREESVEKATLPAQATGGEEEALHSSEHVQAKPDEDETIVNEGVESMPTKADEPAVSASPPPAPPSRPPIPPPFVREPSDLPPPRSPSPASQEDPEVDEPTPASPRPLPKGRPPILSLPPSLFSQREAQTPAASAPSSPILSAAGAALEKAQSAAEDQDGEGEGPIKPPMPVHPPRGDLPAVITASERAFILSLPEILSPAEEAFDESTAGVEVDAPSVAKIAEGHSKQEEQVGVETGGMKEAHKPKESDNREEGVATPAFEQPEPNLAAGAQAGEKKKGGGVGDLRKELAGRLAPLAADQTKTGGVSPPSRAVPAAQESGEATSSETEAREETEARGSGGEGAEQEEEDPEQARRRALAARMAKLGGVGMGPMFGGFGLKPPPARKQSYKKETVEDEGGEEKSLEAKNLQEQAVQSGSEGTTPAASSDSHPPRRIGGIPMGGFALPGIAPPRLPSLPPTDAEAEVESQSQSEDDDEAGHAAAVAHEDDDVDREEEREEETAPPPLPPNRPPPAPSRSIPAPTEEQSDEGDYIPSVPADGPEEGHEGAYVAEPEEHDQVELEQEEQQEEGDEMPPPPPPPRPAGGHQASLPYPQSPSLQQQAQLARSPTPTGSLKRSSTLFSNAAEKLGFSPSPRQSLDLSLHAAGSATAHAPETPDQAPAPYDVASLQHFSSTMGAQIFAAAHTLRSSSSSSSSSSRGGGGKGDEDFIKRCFEKAAEAQEPVFGAGEGGGRFGQVVFQARREEKGGKEGERWEGEEVRAGDVLAVSAKFKHALSSRTFGSPTCPHLAIVAAYDPKKGGKIKTVEVDPKSGNVEEGSYKVDELKSGWIRVWRAVPRSSQ